MVTSCTGCVSFSLYVKNNYTEKIWETFLISEVGRFQDAKSYMRKGVKVSYG
jgi:uncharacterized protein YaeQ